MPFSVYVFLFSLCFSFGFRVLCCVCRVLFCLCCIFSFVGCRKNTHENASKNLPETFRNSKIHPPAPGHQASIPSSPTLLLTARTAQKTRVPVPGLRRSSWPVAPCTTGSSGGLNWRPPQRWGPGNGGSLRVKPRRRGSGGRRRDKNNI